MSEQGIASRRGGGFPPRKSPCFVNGETVDTLGTKVDPDVEITLKSKGKNLQDQKLTILLNKPLGYVSCQPEDGHKEGS